MKTSIEILVLIGVGLCHSATSQSTFAFHNYAPDSGIDAPVFDAGGNRLFGTNFLALLYGGATADRLRVATYGNSASFMLPVPIDRMRRGEAGYFDGPTVTTLANGCGGLAWLQVRAWDARLGPTYEDVVGLGIGGYGESPLFQARGGDACPLEPSPGLPLIVLRPAAGRAGTELRPAPFARLARAVDSLPPAPANVNKNKNIHAQCFGLAPSLATQSKAQLGYRRRHPPLPNV